MLDGFSMSWLDVKSVCVGMTEAASSSKPAPKSRKSDGFKRLGAGAVDVIFERSGSIVVIASIAKLAEDDVGSELSSGRASLIKSSKV